MNKLLIFLILLLSINLLSADYYQNNLKDNEKEKNKNETNIKKSSDSFIFIPGYSFSSGVGSKVSGTFLYYDKKYSSSFPNSFKAKVKYGSQKEFSFGVSHSRYFLNRYYILTTSFTTGRYSSSLYPIHSKKKSKVSPEAYDTSNNYFNIGFRFKKYKFFYFGPSYTFSHYNITSKKDNGVLENNLINGSEKTLASGVGLIISKEERENRHYPSYGYFTSFNNYIYPSFLGSSTLYDTMSFSFKSFHSLYRRIIFAFQFYTRAVFGDAPFQKMSYLGGENILRGYNSSKYFDRRFMGTQFEIRFPVFWRFSGTLFAGAAQVTDDFFNHFNKPWKVSAGFGFRFRLDPKDNINFRLDFAYNENGDMYMYITTLEAF